MSDQVTKSPVTYEEFEEIIGTAGAETVRDAERYEREGWPMPIGADEKKHKRGWSRAR